MFEKITAAPADPILGLTEEFKADVLESGKVRYEVKLKPLTLPSGKKIKLATTKKEEDVS